jgi:hypothetical protein
MQSTKRKKPVIQKSANEKTLIFKELQIFKEGIFFSHLLQVQNQVLGNNILPF